MEVFAGQIDEKKLNELINKLSMYNPSIERSKAAAELVKIGPTAIPFLIKQLDDKSNNRSMVIAILGHIGNPSVVPVLKKYINDDESIRWNTFNALAEIGNDESINVLLDMYRDPDIEPLDIYYVAQSLLEKCSKPAGVSTLIKAAEEDNPIIIRDGSVRWTSNLAMETLGNMKEKKSHSGFDEKFKKIETSISSRDGFRNIGKN